MYMSFRCLNLSFISLKLCNEVSAGLGCFCLCFFLCWLAFAAFKSQREFCHWLQWKWECFQVKYSPCILTPPPNFLFWQMTPDLTTVWNTHGRVCILFNYIMNETSGKIPKTWEDIFLMLKTLDEFSKPRLNWLFYLNLNDPITVSLF